MGTYRWILACYSCMYHSLSSSRAPLTLPFWHIATAAAVQLGLRNRPLAFRQVERHSIGLGSGSLSQNSGPFSLLISLWTNYWPQSAWKYLYS